MSPTRRSFIKAFIGAGTVAVLPESAFAKRPISMPLPDIKGVVICAMHEVDEPKAAYVSWDRGEDHPDAQPFVRLGGKEVTVSPAQYEEVIALSARLLDLMEGLLR